MTVCLFHYIILDGCIQQVGLSGNMVVITMARISIYDKWDKDGMLNDKLKQVEAWSRDGLVQQQIADNLGISIDTLILYKKQYSEFSEALKRGKEVIDIEVENALYKRAIGYTYEEVKEEEMPDGRIRRTVTTKEVAGDTTAQIFWLKNRKPAEWRDKQNVEIEQSKPFEVNITVVD